MQLKEKQNEALIRTYAEAKHFLGLTAKEEAVSDWVRHLRVAKESRTFFTGPLKSSTGFAIHAATLVAMSYVECFGMRSEPPAPTAREVQYFGNEAHRFHRCVVNTSWLHPDDAPAEFRERLRNLAAKPSRIPPRPAGSPGLPLRKRFIESLAESIYYLSSTFPIGFLTVAASLGWENISDREVRKVLSKSARAEISSRVVDRRENSRLSELEKDAIIDGIKRICLQPTPPVADQRSDGEKLELMIEMARTFTDDIAGQMIIEALTEHGDEYGIIRPVK